MRSLQTSAYVAGGKAHGTVCAVEDQCEDAMEALESPGAEATEATGSFEASRGIGEGTMPGLWLITRALRASLRLRLCLSRSSRFFCFSSTWASVSFVASSGEGWVGGLGVGVGGGSFPSLLEREGLHEGREGDSVGAIFFLLPMVAGKLWWSAPEV